MMKIVGDSRRFVAAVFAAAIVVGTVADTAVAAVADTPAVFAATVVDTAIAADTVVAVVAVDANHSKN